MFFLLLFSQLAWGSPDLFFKYGTGFLNSSTQTKFFSGGYLDELPPFIYQVELGVFADGKGSTGFIDGAFGMEVHAEPIFLSSVWGVALISHTDERLSTVYQFNQDFSLGFRDYQGRSISLAWKHLSNAGIVQPNIGRDFLLVKVQFPL